jgi:hypothetical protein
VLKIGRVCQCLQYAPIAVESLEIQGFSGFPAIRQVILRNRGLQVRLLPSALRFPLENAVSCLTGFIPASFTTQVSAQEAGHAA